MVNYFNLKIHVIDAYYWMSVSWLFYYCSSLWNFKESDSGYSLYFSCVNFRVFVNIQFSSVQSLSRVRVSATPWIAAHQASLSITNSWSLLRLMSIELMMPSSHLILCRPLLLLPPIPPSIRVFSSESTLLIRWPKYWSFSFSISPSKEHPGLISIRMDWLDLLVLQGTLKSLLQNHSSKVFKYYSPLYWQSEWKVKFYFTV